MAQIPIVHSLHQEFVLYVLIVDTENTMDEVCQIAAESTIAFETNKRAGGTLRVRRSGEEEPFPRDLTLGEAGVTPMSSLEIFYEEAEGPGRQHNA